VDAVCIEGKPISFTTIMHLTITDLVNLHVYDDRLASAPNLITGISWFTRFHLAIGGHMSIRVSPPIIALK
jgi:hypothetical protein